MESLVAFAILSLVLGAAYMALAQGSARKARLVEDMNMARLGRVALTEYAVTWPTAKPVGQLGERWHWTIRETALPGGSQERDLGIRYVKLEIIVSDLQGAAPDYRLATAVMRKLRQ